MFDTNAIGRMIALAAAEAELADLTSADTAMPSAANDPTPTRNVTTAAGILAASISKPYATTPSSNMNTTPMTAMITAARMNPAI